MRFIYQLQWNTFDQSLPTFAQLSQMVTPVGTLIFKNKDKNHHPRFEKITQTSTNFQVQDIHS